MLTSDIRPGDVISAPLGITRTHETIVIHDIYIYNTGDVSIRYRYASNPRGIDWSGFVSHDEAETRLVARGIARVDPHIRSLLN